MKNIVGLYIYFNSKGEIWQLCYGENHLLFLDQHAEIDFYSASWLQLQCTNRHADPLEHIILILRDNIHQYSCNNPFII
jgi:hypothetical protein